MNDHPIKGCEQSQFALKYVNNLSTQFRNMEVVNMNHSDGWFCVIFMKLGTPVVAVGSWDLK
jgi:hypothetical protein